MLFGPGEHGRGVRLTSLTL